MMIMAFILSLCPSLRNVTYFSFPGIKPPVDVCTVVSQFPQATFDLVSVCIIQSLKSSHGNGKAKIFQWPKTAGDVFLSALGLICPFVLVCFFVFVLKFWNVCNSRQSSRTWRTVLHRLLSLARSSLSTIWWVMYFLDFIWTTLTCRAYLDDS